MEEMPHALVVPYRDTTTLQRHSIYPPRLHPPSFSSALYGMDDSGYPILGLLKCAFTLEISLCYKEGGILSDQN